MILQISYIIPKIRIKERKCIFKKDSNTNYFIYNYIFTGCIKKLDSEGLTLQIQESELNNFSQKFPINQDFVFAFVQLEKPYIYIKNGSNRLTATINTNFSTVLCLIQGEELFSLTGSPYFDKKNLQYS